MIRFVADTTILSLYFISAQTNVVNIKGIVNIKGNVKKEFTNFSKNIQNIKVINPIDIKNEIQKR